MSRTNVKIVEQALEAFNPRDMSALAALSHEDLEIVSTLTAANLGESTYRGSDAFTAYFAAIDESWDEWRIEDIELLDGGEDRVACLCRLVGRGKQSGVPVERAVGIAYRIRDEQLWRIRSYLDPGDALDAAGVSAG
jgi:ketosteroid isomerase-like protein